MLAFHWARGRVSDRALLGLSYGLMAVGSLLFAVAPDWPEAMGGAVVVGIGFGGIDYGLNQIFATGFGHRGAAMLNLLNANFGIGAVAGPALIAWLGAGNYPWLFGAAAVACVILLPSLAGVRSQGAVAAGEPAPVTVPSRAIALIVAFVAIYVLHVAIETGVGGWEPTHLEAVGYGASVAATATASYWLAMTVGRFLTIPLSLRFSAPLIVTASCLGMAACLILATIPAAAPYAYVGVGLSIAPIFPTGLPWLNRAVPGIASAGAFVISAAMLGGVAFPPVLGKVIEMANVRSVPLLLFVLALTCAALSFWLRRATATKRAASAMVRAPQSADRG